MTFKKSVGSSSSNNEPAFQRLYFVKLILFFFFSFFLYSNCMRSVVKSESMMFERNGTVVHKNCNGAISIATPHIDGDSVSK